MRSDIHVVTSVIRSSLPREVAFAGGRIEDADEPLFPGEASAVARAVTKRRHEFVAGRTYARRALAGLSVGPVSIPVGERREPIWPAGVVGSISHCDEYCAAIVARADAFAGIGFDVEPDGLLGADVVEATCSAAELAALADGGVDAPKLIFCIKESIYKAYFPLARTFLDFSDVAVNVRRDGTFTARLTRAELPAVAGERVFAGRFARVGGFITAWTLIRARSAER